MSGGAYMASAGSAAGETAGEVQLDQGQGEEEQAEREQGVEIEFEEFK